MKSQRITLSTPNQAGTPGGADAPAGLAEVILILQRNEKLCVRLASNGSKPVPEYFKPWPEAALAPRKILLESAEVRP